MIEDSSSRDFILNINTGFFFCANKRAHRHVSARLDM